MPRSLSDLASSAKGSTRVFTAIYRSEEVKCTIRSKMSSLVRPEGIGSAICTVLLPRVDALYMWDPEERVRNVARRQMAWLAAHHYDRFYVIEDEAGIDKVASNVDLIIGASGKQTCTSERIQSLLAGSRVIMASVSSRQIEIDVDYLERTKLHVEDGVSPEEGTARIPLWTDYHLPQQKVITLIYKGFPANFAFGESLDRRTGDLVYSLLYEGLRLVLQMRNQPPGVVDVNVLLSKVQQDLERSYWKYSPDEA